MERKCLDYIHMPLICDTKGPDNIQRLHEVHFLLKNMFVLYLKETREIYVVNFKHACSRFTGLHPSNQFDVEWTFGLASPDGVQSN